MHRRIQKHIKHSVHNKICYVVIYDTYFGVKEMVRPSVFRILWNPAIFVGPMLGRSRQIILYLLVPFAILLLILPRLYFFCDLELKHEWPLFAFLAQINQLQREPHSRDRDEKLKQLQANKQAVDRELSRMATELRDKRQASVRNYQKVWILNITGLYSLWQMMKLIVFPHFWPEI